MKALMARIPFGVRMAVATALAVTYLATLYHVEALVRVAWAGVAAMLDEAEDRWRDWLDGWREVARCREWTDGYAAR